jgi:phosphopantetheinyl transferase (holo-ACP synthase)
MTQSSVQNIYDHYERAIKECKVKAQNKKKEEKAIMKKIEALEKRRTRLEKQLYETDSQIYALQLSLIHSE